MTIPSSQESHYGSFSIIIKLSPLFIDGEQSFTYNVSINKLSIINY